MIDSHNHFKLLIIFTESSIWEFAERNLTNGKLSEFRFKDVKKEELGRMLGQIEVLKWNFSFCLDFVVVWIS